MKRIFSLLAICTFGLAAMAQNAGILLSYNKGEELKFYRSNDLAKAIDDAEVNDTLYFGAGDYDLVQFPQYENSTNTDHRQLTKPLTFIGAGAQDNGTRFTRGFNLFINIDPSIKDESKRNVSFEGINFSSRWDIFPASNINELKFVNSNMRFSDNGYSDYYMQEEPDYKVNKLIIDRCRMDNLSLTGNKVGKADVKNTKIEGYVYGNCSDNSAAAALNHCYIGYIDSNFIGLITNSFIYYDYASAENVLQDCYYYGSYYSEGNSTVEDCKTLDTSDVDYCDNNPSPYGNCSDGTLYGSLGGNNPFTLYPSYPTPDTTVDSNDNKKSFIDYDIINKNLTVTVTLLGEGGSSNNN